LITIKKQLNVLANLYIKGYEINWAVLHKGESQRKISLPGYSFDKHRYWIHTSYTNNNFSITNMVHPLIDVNKSILWTKKSFEKLLTGKEFYLKDHKVHEEMILPGVIYLEMARIAGEFSTSNKVIGLRNIMWIQPFRLINQEQGTKIQINLHHNNSEITFEVCNQKKLATENSLDPLIIYAQGKVICSTQDQLVKPNYFEIETIKQRCLHYRSAEIIYSQFAKIGLNYGSSFRTLKNLWFNDQEVLAYLELPVHLHAGAEQFYLHPSILDGALQATFQLADNNLYLPFSIGELVILRSLPLICYAYINIIKSTEGSTVKSYHIRLLDEVGETLVEIKNFVALKYSVDQQASRVHYYKPFWEERNINSSTKLIGPILVLAPDLYLLHALKKQIPETIVIATKFGECYKAHDEYYEININKAEDYHMLFKSLEGKNQFPRAIIFKNLKKGTAIERLELYIFNLLVLSQALIKHNSKEILKILLIHEIDQGDAALLAEAGSGFAKTLNIEHPHLLCKVVQIENLELIAIVSCILQELIQQEKEVRYNANGQREVKVYKEIVFAEQSFYPGLLKNQGAYLITGGMGGLGLIFTKYLSQQYKANVILTGRSELTDLQKGTIAELKKLGSKICYIKSDLSNKVAVKDLLQQVKLKVGNLNGIIHSAGVIKDSLISKKTIENVAAVLAPKVAGTFYLDELTQTEHLDFFVLFSSIAAVLGNMGQCDYAYANSFMDHFATWRETLRSQQLRYGATIAINWPLWEQGGMQVNENVIQWMEQSLGLYRLSIDEGIKAFVKIIANKNLSQVIVLNGNKEQLNKLLQGSMQHDMFYGKVTTDLATIEQSGLSEKIQAQLLQMMSELLKIEINQLDINEELREYGIDSILIVKFIGQINQLYQLELSPAILFEHTSLASLIQYLIKDKKTALIDYYKGESFVNNKIKINNQVINNHADLAVIEQSDLSKKIQTQLLQMMSELLKIEINQLDINEELREYGVDSILIVKFINQINQLYQLELSPATLFEHTSLASLIQYLIKDKKAVLIDYYKGSGVS
jgi:acyl carrier protein/NADP-dependent 3-hydroxy acid dehydrogenase YdfG